MEDSQKTCTKCNLLKSIDRFEFRKDTSKYRNICKDCDNENNRLYRDNNREAVTLKDKEYYLKNKEYLCNSSKNYRLNNKETVKLAREKYVINNKDKIKDYLKEYNVKNSARLKPIRAAYVLKNKEKVKIWSKNSRLKHIDSITNKAKLYHFKNKDKISERHRLRYSENLENEALKRREKVEALGPIGRKKYWDSRPGKAQVANAVRKAIVNRKLIKADKCEKCDSTVKLHAHHDSYLLKDRLNVKWLCPLCHSRYHSEFKMLALSVCIDNVIYPHKKDTANIKTFTNAVNEYTTGIIPESLNDIEKDIYIKTFEWLTSLKGNFVKCEYGNLTRDYLGISAICKKELSNFIKEHIDE